MTLDLTAISERIDDLRDERARLEQRDPNTTTDDVLNGARRTAIIAEIHHLTAIKHTNHNQ
jgi:hypothetical protein